VAPRPSDRSRPVTDLAPTSGRNEHMKAVEAVTVDEAVNVGDRKVVGEVNEP